MLKTIQFYVVTYTLVAVFSVFYILQGLVFMLFSKTKKEEKFDLSIEPSCLNDGSLGTHGTVRLPSRNLEVHYVAKGDKSKPLMLFLHGFPEFWYYWKYQLKEFGTDYYAVAVDMTGYGGTSKPAELRRYESYEIAKDINEFVKELGFKSCILVGHDWGGGISYAVATIFPDLVERLIVMNCPSSQAFKKGFTFKQLLMSSYMFYFQLPYVPEFFLSQNNCAVLKLMPNTLKNPGNMTEEDVAAYRYAFTKGGFTGPLNYYRSSIMMSPSRKRELAKKYGKYKITSPSLIIWGTEDVALGKHLAVLSADSIADCKLEYVENASHFVNLERPEEVNRIMRNFLPAL